MRIPEHRLQCSRSPKRPNTLTVRKDGSAPMLHTTRNVLSLGGTSFPEADVANVASNRQLRIRRSHAPRYGRYANRVGCTHSTKRAIARCVLELAAASSRLARQRKCRPRKTEMAHRACEGSLSKLLNRLSLSRRWGRGLWYRVRFGQAAAEFTSPIRTGYAVRDARQR